MDLKYIAIIIILAISFYIAFLVKQKGKTRILINEALCDFIEYIKNQIDFFCTPTADIITSYENEILEKYEFVQLLEENDWGKAIYESSAGNFIDKRIADVLENFSKKLGRTSPEEQIANCEYTLGELRKHLDELKNEVPKKSKVYSALSVVSGFMAAILIL